MTEAIITKDELGNLARLLAIYRLMALNNKPTKDILEAKREFYDELNRLKRKYPTHNFDNPRAQISLISIADRMIEDIIRQYKAN